MSNTRSRTHGGSGALALILLATSTACPAVSGDGDELGSEDGADVLRCIQRDEAQCEEPPFFGDTECRRVPEVWRVPPGEQGCSLNGGYAVCVEFPSEGPAGCPDTPACGIPGESAVWAREYLDGGDVDLFTGDYCGIEPNDYERCVWSEGAVGSPGMLEQGPAECACWCDP